LRQFSERGVGFCGGSCLLRHNQLFWCSLKNRATQQKSTGFSTYFSQNIFGLHFCVVGNGLVLIKEQDKERKIEAVEDDQSKLSDEELKHEEDFPKEEKQAESQETAQTGKRDEKIEGESILTVNRKTNFENAACVPHRAVLKR